MTRYLEALVRQEGAGFVAECSRARVRAEGDSPERALAGLEGLLVERLPGLGESLSDDEPLVLVTALYCGRIAAS